MKYTNLITVIEEIAPLTTAASWDKSGIQVVSTRDDISHLAVCLDPTLDSIQKALTFGADMVLSHHPLTLVPRFLDTIDDYYNIVALLCSANVPLYTAHTSLDANLYGPASWLAEVLGLSECSVLEPVYVNDSLSTQYGLGRIGKFFSPVDSDKFLQLLQPWLVEVVPRIVGELPAQIHRVAFCPGSGASYMKHAADQHADVFITGDIKYHQAMESPLPIIDVGHFCLEEEMMHRMAQQLEPILLDVTVTFIAAQDPLRALYQ